MSILSVDQIVKLIKLEESVTLFKGYSYFVRRPGECDKVFCQVCKTECVPERDVLGPTSSIEGMMGSKTLHDSFACPHASEEWHDEALKLVREYDETASKRLKNLIRDDINDLLDEHLPDGDYWSGK